MRYLVWVAPFFLFCSCSVQLKRLTPSLVTPANLAGSSPATPTPVPVGATQLNFSIAAQSELTWACTAITIGRKDAGNLPYTTGATTFNLTGSNSQFFSDPSCLTSIVSATIIDTASSQTVYVRFTTPGSNTITASLSPLTPGSQVNTVTLDPYTWTGVSLDHKWCTASNWSGGVVPNQSFDHAIFDGNCISCNAELDAGASNLNILYLNLYSPYPGTLTQDSGSALTLGTFTQEGGTFLGGNAAITTSNSYLTGGTFTSTSGTLALGAHVSTNILSNTFHANAGSVVTTGDNNTLNASGIQFANLTLHTDALDLFGTFSVSGSLVLDPVGSTAVHTGTLLILNGSAPQVISDAQLGAESSDGVPLKINSASSVSVSGNAMLGDITIMAGTLSLGTGSVDAQSLSLTGGTLTSTSGSLTTHGSISFTAGTFNPNTGKIIFNGVYNTFVATGFTFYDLSLQNDLGSTLSTSINVAHNFSFDAASGPAFINGSVIMSGTGTITDVQNGSGGYFGSGLIVNTAGSITLASANAAFGAFEMQAGSFNGGDGSNAFNGNFTLSGGAFNATSSASNFLSSFGTLLVSGGTFNHHSGTFNFYSNLSPSVDANIEFYNVSVLGSGGSIAFFKDFQVDGTLTLNNTGNFIYGNTITLLGNVVNTQSIGMSTYFPTLLFSGTAAQTYSGAGNYLGAVNVSKTSGGVSLLSNLSLGGNAFSILSGVFSLNGHSLLDGGGAVTVSSGATLNCNGGCGAGTSCNLGSNELQCATLTNNGTLTP